MKFLTKASICAATASFFLLPSVAQAKRPGVLEGKPIVERKKELRKFRVFITPYSGMSLAQPYVHVVPVGASLAFNFTDSLGLRVLFDYSVFKMKTKLTRALTGDGEDDQSPLPRGVNRENPSEPGDDRPSSQIWEQAPLLHDFQAGLTQLQWQGSADFTFTPFSGKLGLFSSIFQSYDLYLFAGVGFQNWTQHYKGAKSTTERKDDLKPNTNPNSLEDGACRESIPGTKATRVNDECALHPVVAQTGTKIGPSFGGGVHIFVTDWMAINTEVQNVLYKHNDTGFSSNREVFPIVDSKDNAWRHNITWRLGFSFYLPGKAKRRVSKP